MYIALLKSHSGLRYVALFALLYVLFCLFKGNKNQLVKVAFVTNTIFVFQILLGFILYILSSKVFFDVSIMKSTILRFFTLEHPLMMVISTVLMLFGYKKIINLKYTSARWLYICALVLIIAAIPWPFRSILGAQWF